MWADRSLNYLVNLSGLKFREAQEQLQIQCCTSLTPPTQLLDQRLRNVSCVLHPPHLRPDQYGLTLCIWKSPSTAPDLAEGFDQCFDRIILNREVARNSDRRTQVPVGNHCEFP